MTPSAFPGTNLCKLPQPTVVGYDGPEIMAVALIDLSMSG